MRATAGISSSDGWIQQLLTDERLSVRFAALGALTGAVLLVTLEALLWGPPRTQMSFHTALPTPAEVLRYSGREPGWGARVTLRSPVIRDGVATADPLGWVLKGALVIANPGGRAQVTAIQGDSAWRKVALLRLPIAVALFGLAALA
jgi:hypothetical protein